MYEMPHITRAKKNPIPTTTPYPTPTGKGVSADDIVVPWMLVSQRTPGFKLR